MNGVLPILFVSLFFWAGCSEETAAPEEAATQQAGEVEGAPTPDSIDVVDDERSLERRIEDAALATEVRIALVDANELRRFNFEPEVVNGQVFLRGEVNTQGQRSRAAAIASEIEGVRGVRNEITALEEPTVASQAPDTSTADTADQDALAQAREDQPASEEPAEDEGQTADATSDDQADQTSSEETEEQATYHTVKSGESLWTISRNYGVSIDQIRRLNDLTSNNLRPGQRLQVK